MAAAAAVAHAAREARSRQKKKIQDGAGEQVDSDPLFEQQEPQEPPPPLTGIWRWQRQAGTFYNSMEIQVGVALLIIANFCTNIVEKTVDPFGTKYKDAWYGLELFYNIVFLIELLVNMYSSWFRPFWSSSWNVFDFVVVSIGVLTTLEVPLGPLTLLRMMRAFRVFRLFKRIESLRKIMSSLAKAVPGMINACIIQVIVMCIYAIIGVELFGTHGAGGSFTSFTGASVSLKSNRNMDYGQEYFYNFPKALYTMFQVLTGESWSEVVARPLIYSEDLSFGIGCALYFTSFTIVNGIILINVVVAVLLENMTAPEEPKEEEGQPEAVASDKVKLKGALTDVHKDLDEVKGLMDEVMSALLKMPAASRDGTPRQGVPESSPRSLQ